MVPFYFQLYLNLRAIVVAKSSTAVLTYAKCSLPIYNSRLHFFLQVKAHLTFD